MGAVRAEEGEGRRGEQELPGQVNEATGLCMTTACTGGSSESRDSGVSGGSQDTGDTSPNIRPGKRDSVQFSTLVRKLSEVEGINPSHILR